MHKLGIIINYGSCSIQFIQLGFVLNFNHFFFKFLCRTSVLFVSISFIVLMIISFVWLVFYYVQRFRYLQTKDRKSVSDHWSSGVRA